MSFKNIYFIDGRVQNKEALISDIGDSAKWYVLDSSLDGIAKMQMYFPEQQYPERLPVSASSYCAAIAQING